jgi:hypothetical protein
MDDPRKTSDDHLGTMICFHRKYSLGDTHEYRDPTDFLHKLTEEINGDHDEMFDALFQRDTECNLQKSRILMLPLYLYDHSGITMATTPFTCTFDSGQVGLIYVKHSDIIKEYGDASPESVAKALEVLQSEVKDYDNYLTGDTDDD